MTARIAYHADESYFDRPGGTFLLIRVTEGEAGYEPVEGFHTVEDAVAAANRANVGLGLSPKDVLDIRLSSMAASAPRDEFAAEMGRLGRDFGYPTLGELITIIVRDREDLTADSAMGAAALLPWDDAWASSVGPALDRLTELLVAYGAVRTEG